MIPNFRQWAIVFALTLLVGTACAAPPLPCSFWGTVTVNDSPAPAGTNIVAKINWNERGSTETIEIGNYGSEGLFGNALLVSAFENDFPGSELPTVTFWIGENKAINDTEFKCGGVVRLDLVFTTNSSGNGQETPVSGDGYTFSLDDITTNFVGNHQEVVVKTVYTTASVSTNGNNIVINQPGGGWDEIIISTQDAPLSSGNSFTGVVSGVSAKSKELNAEVGTAGTVSAGIQVTMDQIPSSNARIETTVSKEPPENVKNAFLLTAKSSNSGADTADIAYVLNVNKENIANKDEDGIIRSATIWMTVSSSWVSKHGGADSVVIVRRDDNGALTSLSTKCVGKENENYVFEALSPDGLSIFALVSAYENTGTSNGAGSSAPPSDSGSGGEISGTVFIEPSFTEEPNESKAETPAPKPSVSASEEKQNKSDLSPDETPPIDSNTTAKAYSPGKSDFGIFYPVLLVIILAIVVFGVFFVLYDQRKP